MSGGGGFYRSRRSEYPACGNDVVSFKGLIGRNRLLSMYKYSLSINIGLINLNLYNVPACLYLDAVYFRSI